MGTRVFYVTTGLVVWLAALALVRPMSRASATTNAEPTRSAIERGLGFLQKDALRWKKEKICATCHHGTMTVWALAEGQPKGFATSQQLAESFQWTKERLADIDKPRDPRPGWRMLSTPALYLAVMAAGLPRQEALPPGDLKRIAGHLVRHQEKDGSWAWSSAPAQNRPPPVFESDEVATLLALIALGGSKSGEAPEAPGVDAARTKATSWLAKTTPSDTTQAAALRLLLKFRSRASASEWRADRDALLGRQNADGGWGQVPRSASDAFATGQALYALFVTGMAPERLEVQRAIHFLVATQRADGSWPMVARAHPGATPSRNILPITYFGSAWATIGLLRSAPETDRPLLRGTNSLTAPLNK